VASDKTRRCPERMSVFIGTLRRLCYNTEGTAEISEDIQDITHEIASGRCCDRAFPVFAKRP